MDASVPQEVIHNFTSCVAHSLVAEGALEFLREWIIAEALRPGDKTQNPDKTSRLSALAVTRSAQL